MAVIAESAISKRLVALGPITKAEPVFEAGFGPLRQAAAGGAWFAVKASIDDVSGPKAKPRGKAAELQRALAQHFVDGDGSAEAAPAIALEAIARAIALEAGNAEDAKVELGGDTYEVKVMSAKAGGRARVRLRNPDAVPAEEPAEEEAAAE